MSHNTALEAHEHTEHAEHAAHQHDPFIAKVSITVAALAVAAALAGSLETVEGGKALAANGEAVLHQDEATDAWNEFQADSLKKHMYTIAANGGGANADDYSKEAKEQSDAQKEDRKKAEEQETERTNLLAESAQHEERHHWLTGAATLFEIGIAMSTVAIITRNQMLWYGALAFAIGGAVLFVPAYAM
jgi:hypothetical protein